MSEDALSIAKKLHCEIIVDLDNKIKIVCVEHYASVLEFAKKIGKEKHFLEKIEQLKRLGFIELYKDFAPYSFSFVVFRNGVRTFNGGLIYHGFDGGSGGAPSFSVTLTETDGWSIHT